MDKSKALLNQNDLFFLEKLNVPSCFLNKDFDIVFANPGFLNLFSIKKAHLADKNLKAFFRFEKDKLHTELADSEKHGFPAIQELVFLNEKPIDNEHRKARLFIQPYNIEKQFFLLQVTEIKIFRQNDRPDVTDQHLFKLLLNELPDAIYFKDNLGRFFLTNRLHIKKLGLNNVDEFIGKTDFDLFTEEHAQQAFNDEQHVIRSGETISKEEKETHLDGSETWASTSKMPLRNEQGKIVGTFGISKDITQIKNAEIQLRKAEKILQEANAAKDTFFSILAHDLKNPFNSLIGMSDLLLDEFDDLSDDEKIQMLTRIHQTSESAYALLENLLDWSRVQTGALSIYTQNLELEPLVDEILELSHLHAYAKNISIIKSVPGSTVVLADDNMLRTIIRNLVSNAIKFTRPGGEIKILAETEDGKVKITIEDNGVGMDDKTLKRLFKISEKIKTYGTADESGTGLGLIIVREFVEKNKGSITVSSTEGKGSKFVVLLPSGN
jgi:PAS domain S-box-containing protein